MRNNMPLMRTLATPRAKKQNICLKPTKFRIIGLRGGFTKLKGWSGHILGWERGVNIRCDITTKKYHCLKVFAIFSQVQGRAHKHPHTGTDITQGL